MNILIAEDDVMNQLLIGIFMSNLEWHYTIVENGFLAVNACRTGSFDAIIMDIEMPALNGKEAARRIRVFNKVIPIIAFTAYANIHNNHQCTSAGMNAFIEKPATEDILRDTVIKLVAVSLLSKPESK
ncbi:MAG: response regulator [Bacteroidales bacterium]|nr:response regulator [Bacteroidales bacterium]